MRRIHSSQKWSNGARFKKAYLKVEGRKTFFINKMSLRVCVNKHLSFGYFLVFLSHPIKKNSMHSYTHIQIEKMDAAYMHDTIDIYKLTFHWPAAKCQPIRAKNGAAFGAIWAVYFF